MKKALCLLLALLLALSLCAGALAEDEGEIPGTVEVPYAGFRFAPPERFRDTVGVVRMDGVMELEDEIYVSYWTYYAMTEEELTAYLSDRSSDAPVENRINSLFFVITIGKGIPFRSFNAMMHNSIPVEYVRELGKVGDWSFYLYMEEPNRDFIDVLGLDFKEEYAALASAADEVAAGFSLFEPTEKPDPYAGLVGVVWEFTTADLDGNAVSSADLFASNEITLVNLWTTWCAPCIEELRELQALHAALAERGCGVVGMMLDDDLDAARRLMTENGVAYPVILGPDTMFDLIPVESVPTTLFIGRDGAVLAPPIVGAYPEEYAATVDALLGE